MKKSVLIVLILFSGLALGQETKTIAETVSQINTTKNYVIKTVPYDYFTDKNETADNGIELKGYYKNGQLKKMEYFLGLSAWKIETEYFF